MTRIDFFSNAPDRVIYVARLLAKVTQSNQTAVVFADQDLILQLSDCLWQSAGFVAHSSSLLTPDTDTDADTHTETSSHVTSGSQSTVDITPIPNDFEGELNPQKLHMIHLSHIILEDWPHHQNLINLSNTIVDGFATFERLIEVVPNEANEKEAARNRWNQYKKQGYPMTHYDIAALKNN